MARLAFVRGADASTEPDGGGLDGSRGCERMVGVGGVGVGVDGESMTQSMGLRTSKTPGVPACAALAAFVAQRAVSVVVLPRGNTGTEESRHVNRTAMRVQMRVPVQTQMQMQVCVDGIDKFERERTHALNRGQRSTLHIQA